LVVKRFGPRLNLGALLFAALYSDLLLWVLVIVGVESVIIPEATASARFFSFVFPYSHGLVPNILWSVLAGVAGLFSVAPQGSRRSKLAWALVLAVFSHFVLDLIVHVVEQSLWRPRSRRRVLTFPVRFRRPLCWRYRRWLP
jgi:hypothetical protein